MCLESVLRGTPAAAKLASFIISKHMEVQTFHRGALEHGLSTPYVWWTPKCSLVEDGGNRSCSRCQALFQACHAWWRCAHERFGKGSA